MKDGSLDPSVRDPEAAFGYGRRVWYAGYFVKYLKSP